MTTTLELPNASEIKTRQQATWASGDYAVIGTTLQIVGERLCEAIDLKAGERVLDVAAGNGNATLAAARRFAEVTSTDYVEGLLDAARVRAAAERLEIAFRSADAEALPFADGAFDVALSTFGVMFTPDQAKAATELTRVVRPGGRIGLANWTPEGLIGQLFKVLGRHAPPPPGLKSPLQWGDVDHLRELFPHCRMSATRQEFMFRYLSAHHWLEMFKRYYGPTNRVFAALDETRRAALSDEILALLERFNRGGPESLVAPGEYLEVVITR